MRQGEEGGIEEGVIYAVELIFCIPLFLLKAGAQKWSCSLPSLETSSSVPQIDVFPSGSDRAHFEVVPL